MVTNLDRLGRNIMDIVGTIDVLMTRVVKLHCLVLSGIDLTASAGTLILSFVVAIA